MTFQAPEQVLHDRVNLSRLLRRLEKTFASPEWETEASKPQRATWIKTKGLLQSLQYARQLLRNVQFNDTSHPPSPGSRYDELATTIDRLERRLADIEKRIKPPAARPTPILSTIPFPALPVQDTTSESTISQDQESEAQSSPVEPPETTNVAARDLLLSPDDAAGLRTRPPIDPSSTLLPPSIPGTSDQASKTSAGAPAFLQNSQALQEEMSEQLARMATQLKRNAMHFATSLENDKAVVQDAHEKMERNYDVMTKERVRLRDHRSKSWGTTWLVMLSLFIAAVGFLLTFFVIRLT